MSRNTRYLLGLWAVALMLAAWLAVSFSYSLRLGQVWPVVVPVALAAAVLLYSRWRVGERRIRRLLRSESPTDLVTFYQRTIRRTRFLPDADAVVASASALAYVLYADYPAARAALQGVDWTD